MTASAATLDRTILWAPWNGPGLEHLHLRCADGGFVANGVVLGVADGEPFRLHYKVKCDADWRTRKVVLESHGLGGERIRILRSDGRGRWKADAGEEVGSSQAASTSISRRHPSRIRCRCGGSRSGRDRRPISR